MKAREIMNSLVIRVPGNTSIRNVAELMRREGVGIVCVCDDENRPRGVITDRDIVMRAVASGRSLEHTQADEIMTTSLLTWRMDADVAEISQAMKLKRIGRMLVLDDDGRVAGLITLAEIWHYESPFDAAPVSRTVTERELRVQPSGGHADTDYHADLTPIR